MDAKTALLSVLTERENDHVEWINLLENTIKASVVFTKVANSKDGSFDKWHRSFYTRDETLKELLESFDKSHKKLHALAEPLITLRDNGKQDGALERLAQERTPTLRRLRALFSRGRDQIRSGMGQVLLFITLDGKTPRCALMIDEINDALNYVPANYQLSHSGAWR